MLLRVIRSGSSAAPPRSRHRRPPRARHKRNVAALLAANDGGKRVPDIRMLILNHEEG